MTCGSTQNAKPLLFRRVPLHAASDWDLAFLHQGGLKTCGEGTESADCTSSCRMETAQPYQQGVTGGEGVGVPLKEKG